MSFVHLHTHSDGSLQDGAQTPAQIASRAAELGQPAVAVTDHGRAGSLFKLKKECKKHGIKPIYGLEFYLAPKSHDLRQAFDNYKNSYHITILCKTDQGLKNLFKLSSISWLEGFYYKPRISLDLLEEYSEGLVVLTGCPASYSSVMLLEDREDEARGYIERLSRLFKEDLYFEVQNHDFEIERELLEKQIPFANKMGLPIVATQDSHYQTPDDAELQRNICKLAGGFDYENSGLHFTSREEMENAFPNNPEYLDITLDIAEKCNVEWKTETIWPVYPLQYKSTPEEELEHLSWKGLQEKFSEWKDEETKEKYRDRIQHELKIIAQMGFPKYFLIVQDFVNWCKENDIMVGPGRGSCCGSLVCYCIGITEVDPIQYELYFERFLNPARVSLPDIDLDFSPKGRERALQYVSEKYGPEKCSKIGTFTNFRPKGALRDFARVTGASYSVGDTLANAVPENISGLPLTFEEAFGINPALKKTEHQEILDLAVRSEKMHKLFGIHAGGYLISDTDVSTQVPLCRGGHDEVVTQMDMGDVEDIGLVKYDFLVIKTLSVISETIKLIKKEYDKDIVPSEIKDFDEDVYREIFWKGNLDGVFQFENSAGFKDLCKQVRPRSIEDLSAVTALFRPGPLETGQVEKYAARKNGEEFDYDHPALEPILKNTVGILTYQEQIMQLCVDMANYSLAEADNMRRIIGKKKKELIPAEKEKFLQKCTEHNVDKDIADKIFGDIEGFARYCFNKSHSVAYSFLSYRTAWLKYYYPVEFYTALLNSVINKQDKVVKYINSARDNEIPILPPDINSSEYVFKSDRNCIVFGLSAIKGLGEKKCKELLDKKPQDGFESFFQLLDFGVDLKTFKALVSSGALGSICDIPRGELLDKLPEFIEYRKKIKHREERKEKIAQREKEREEAIENGTKVPRKLKPLGDSPEMPAVSHVSRLSEQERLELERQTLGFYVSGHPLDKIEPKITLEDLLSGENENKRSALVVGVVMKIAKKTTKKKKQMATLIIEDKTGRMEAAVFPKNWQALEDILEEGGIYTMGLGVQTTKTEDEVILKSNLIKAAKIEPEEEFKDLIYPLNSKCAVIFRPISEETNPSRFKSAKKFLEDSLRKE